MGEINEASVAPAIISLMKADLGDTVLLQICSDGGYTAPAYALIDLMRASPAKVITIGIGNIGSAALDIFVAGDQRIAYPSTIGMAHNAWGSADSRQHKSSLKQELALDNARGIALYKERSRYKTEEELHAILFRPRRDTWMNAQQLLEHGLADEIHQPELKQFQLAAQPAPKRLRKVRPKKVKVKV